MAKREKRYRYTIRLEVAESAIEDGFSLTKARAEMIFEKRYPHLNDGELEVLEVVQEVDDGEAVFVIRDPLPKK